MRLIALAFAAILLSSPATAQPDEASSPAAAPSSHPSSLPSSSPTSSRPAPQPDANPPILDLPVSLRRIRGALERPAPGKLLKGLDEKPTFRIEIRERQKIEALLATLDFKSGPTPAGGLYAYEQQRLAFPSVDHPLAQPYAAFSQGQLLTILAENVVGKYVGGRALEAVKKALRARTEATARREIDDAIAEYCGGKPNGGAGIQLCELPPADR